MPPPLKKLKAHPYAELFPMMTDPEIDALAADIKKNGLFDKIYLLDGEILDGRNREEACRRADVDPRFEDYRGKDPLAFVIAKNLPRRHLTETQRATVAAAIATAQRGRRPAANGKDSTHSDPAAAPAKTIKEAAAQMSVSEATVKIAKAIKKKAVPELFKAMQDGTVTANAAAQVAKLPKEQQAELVKAGPQAVKDKAAEMRRPPTTRPMPHETKTPRNKPPVAGLGGEKFSFALIDRHYGALLRAVDAMANARGEKDGTSHKTALENMGAVINHLKRWHARPQKKEAS